MRNYFINKDNKTGEIVYLEYDKNGYSVSPKAKKKDDIEEEKCAPERTGYTLFIYSLARRTQARSGSNLSAAEHGRAYR